MIIDFHTHPLPTDIGHSIYSLGGRLMPRGLNWLYEKLGFWQPAGPNMPLWLKLATIPEIQGRGQAATPEKLLVNMKKLGISRAVGLPIEPVQMTEQIVAASQRVEAGALIPFASVDPKVPGAPDRARVLIDGGCRGLKLHPILQEVAPDDERTMNVLEAIAPTGVPVLLHTGRIRLYLTNGKYEHLGAVKYLEKPVRAFPGLNFVIGHAGLMEPVSARALAERYENVYLETSFQRVAAIKKSIETLGAKRVLFGSDWPFSFQGVSLKHARAATKGNPEARQAILCGNAIRLLKEA